MLETITVDEDIVAEGIDILCDIAFSIEKKSGFHNDVHTGASIDIDAPGIVPTKLCLIHSEISEALEGYRKDLMDDKIKTRTALEVELADAVLRICGLAKAKGLDLGGAIIEKSRYNESRADHDPKNRAKVGGKKF